MEKDNNNKEKKEKLVEEYNQNTQTLQQLTNRQQQIIGQIQLIEEIEEKDKKI